MSRLFGFLAKNSFSKLKQSRFKKIPLKKTAKRAGFPCSFPAIATLNQGHPDCDANPV
jgi:hypothetical protein